jgi:hypothetical protein
MIPFPAALIVAHPGHELRLHRWLEIARPLVFVLTDGSGSGRSRIDSTIDILDTIGCRTSSILGAFTDREIYRLMLNGDVDPVVATTIDMADSLVAHDIQSVVADAFELYNPIHDLCSVMASLAAERACAARFEYAVTKAPSDVGERLELDDAAMARKLATAHRYEELSLEVESLIAKVGLNALRHEVLEPIGTTVMLPKLDHKPFYERYGEERVAEGRYSTVIRYDAHFRSFVEKLIAAVKAIPAPAASHACRS